MSLTNSPFSQKILTNYIPATARECAHISELLIVPTHELSALEAEVKALEGAVAEVEEKKAALDSVIAEHRQLLSPFRRIPDHVLSEVFVYCLPVERNASMVLYEAPMLVTFVSRRWRQVAFSTPGLWATLHIAQIPQPVMNSPSFSPVALAEPSGKAEGGMEMGVEMLNTSVLAHLRAISAWLARSAPCPLSISIQQWPGINHFQHYFPILLAFSHRWHTLRLTVYEASTALALASLAPEAIPLLKVLDLTFSNPPNTVEGHLVWAAPHGGVLNAPALRDVSIHSFPLNLASLYLDWTRLIQLVLCNSGSAVRRSSPSEAHMILSQCTSLVHLTFAVCDLPPPDDALLAAPAYFYLPYLESLSVNDNYPYLSLLFQGIHAPRLARVAYSTQLWPSAQRRSPLLALLEHNGASVRQLTLDPRSLTCAEFLGCVALTPGIARFICRPSGVPQMPQPWQLTGYDTLTMIMAHAMKAVFRVLTPGGLVEGHCAWPRMQSLTCAGRLGIDEESVLDFVRSRMEAAVSVDPSTSADASEILPLREVSIAFGITRRGGIPAPLQEYVQSGLLKVDLPDYRQMKEVVVAMPGVFSARAGVVTTPPPGWVEFPF